MRSKEYSTRDKSLSFDLPSIYSGHLYVKISVNTTVRIERLAAGKPGDVKPVSWWRYTHSIEAKAFGDIAIAKGKTQVARDAGLSRESLYRALSGERNPNFDTILNVIIALGLKLHAEAV